MSLINTMLQDIEQRRPHKKGEPLLQGVRSPAMPKGVRRTGGWIVLALVVCVCALVIAFQLRTPGARDGRAGDAVAQTEALPETVMAPVPAVPPASAEDQEISPMEVTPVVEPVLRLHGVYSAVVAGRPRLILEGDRFHDYRLDRSGNGRLTLQLAGAWQLGTNLRLPTIQGIDQLETHLAPDRLELTFSTAPGTDARLFTLGADVAVGARLVVELTPAEGFTTRPATGTVDESGAMPTPPRPALVDDTPSSPETTAAVRVAGVTAPVQPPIVTRPRPTLLEQAREAQAAGRPVAAIAVYRRLLQRSPDEAQVRREAVQLLLQQGDAQQVQTLLEQGVKQPGAPDFLRLDLTRFYLDQGQLERAYSTLFPAPTGGTSVDRLALEATVLRKSGQLEQSLLRYRRLLQVAPQPRWLIGLAIAAEGTGRWDEALSAYRQVEEDPRASGTLRTFAANRIHAMPSRGIAQ